MPVKFATVTARKPVGLRTSSVAPRMLVSRPVWPRRGHHGHGGAPPPSRDQRRRWSRPRGSVGTGEREAGLGHIWQPDQHPGHHGGDRQTNEPTHGTPPLQTFRT